MQLCRFCVRCHSRQRHLTNTGRLVCPSCSNLLIVTRVHPSARVDDQGKNRLECRTCPFQFVLQKRYYDRMTLKPKEVEDIVGGRDAWENVDKTQVQCPNDKCDSTQAFFYQLQIRSADEPMTSFFKCIKCARQWRE